MKNVLYIFTLLFILSSCQKDDTSGNIIQWKWKTQVWQYPGLAIKYTLLTSDYFVLVRKGINEPQNRPVLVAYHKDSGQYAWDYDIIGIESYFLKDADVSGDYIILTYTDRMVCVSASTRKVVWEQIFPVSCVRESQAEAIGDYVYYSQVVYNNSAQSDRVDSSFLMRTHLVTGQEEILYREKNLSGIFSYSTFLNPVLYKDGSRELAICIQYRESEDYNYPNRDLVAIDLNTKEKIWSVQGIGSKYGPDQLAPFLMDGNVIIGEGSFVRSYKAATGDSNWHNNFILFGLYFDIGPGRPWGHEGKIYVYDQSGYGLCLDAETGEEIWDSGKNKLSEGPSYKPCLKPLIHDDIIFVTSGALRNLVAYDAHTGEVLQNTKEAKFNDTNVLYDADTDQFYVAGDDKLLAFTIKK